MLEMVCGTAWCLGRRWSAPTWVTLRGEGATALFSLPAVLEPMGYCADQPDREGQLIVLFEARNCPKLRDPAWRPPFVYFRGQGRPISILPQYQGAPAPADGSYMRQGKRRSRHAGRAGLSVVPAFIGRCAA